MSLNVGELQARLTLDDDLTPALAMAGKSMTDFGGKLDKAGDKVAKLGRDLLPLSAGLSLVGGASIAMATTFEASMTRLVSIAGVTADEFDHVKESILKMSQDTGVGPQMLAEAMTKVSSTTDDTTKALEILNIAAQGTKAGFGETVGVAGALTAVVNAYAESNLSAARAGDIMAKTIQLGGAEAKELAPTLANVVPQAAQLGVSFEEVGANLATLTKLGVPTAEAVTQLSAVFTALSKETKQGEDALTRVGMSYEGLRASIRDKGLMATLTELEGKFKGNVTGLTDVFGRIEALRNVQGTAGVQGKVYADALDQIKKSSDGAQGALKSMADMMDGTAIQSFAQLKAQVEVLAIRIGDALLPAFKNILGAMLPIVQKVIEMVQWFGALPQPIQTTAIVIGGFLAIAAPGLIALGAGLSAAGAGLTVLGTAATFANGILFTMGNTVPILTARLWLMEAGTKAAAIGAELMAGAFGMVLTGLGITALIIALGVAVWEVGEAFKAAYDHWQSGKSMWDFFTQRDDDNFVRRWMGLSDGLKKTGEATSGLIPVTRTFTSALSDNGAAMEASGTKTVTFSESLRQAMEQVNALSAAQRQEIIDADKMGESQANIAKVMGVSEGAVKLFLEQVDKSSKKLKENAEEQEKLKKYIADTNAEWRRGETSVKDYMEKITEGTKRVTEAIISNITIQRDAERQAASIHREMTSSKFNFAMDSVDLWARNEQLRVDQTQANWVGAYAAIASVAAARKAQIIADTKEIQTELALMGKGAEGFDPSWLAGGFTAAGPPPAIVSLGKTIKDTLKKSLADIPNILMDAFTGGGGLAGGLSAIGTMVGSGVGQDLGEKLGKSIAGIASFAGPMGAAIGALAGPMIEMFSKMLDKTAKGVKKTAEGYGVEVSEAMVEAIKASMKELDMGQQAATIINADKLFPKVDASNFADALKIVHDAFSMVATKQFTVAQGAKVVDDMWGKLAEVGTDATGRISTGMKELIALNEQYGTQSKEIAAFLNEQADAAGNAFAAISKGSTQTFEAISGNKQAVVDLVKEIDTLKLKHDEAAAAGTLSAAQELDFNTKVAEKYAEMNVILGERSALTIAHQAELENLGIIAVATYGAAIAAGKSHLEALQLVQPGMKDLQEAYGVLGISIEDAGLKSLVLGSTILEQNPYLLEAIGGLGSAMVALDNSGRLNIETFSAMQSQGMIMYTRLQAAVVEHGGAAEDALLPMQDYLHQAELQAKNLGVPLDANTQMLIDQSKELGLWKDAGKSANEQLLAGVNALNDTMQNLVNSISGVAGGLGNIPRTVYSDVIITEYRRQGAVNDEGQPIPMAEGGFGTTTKPTLFMTSEDGRPEQYAFSGQGKKFDTAASAGGGGSGEIDSQPFVNAVDRLADAMLGQNEALMIGLRDMLLERG